MLLRINLLSVLFILISHSECKLAKETEHISLE